MSLSVKFTHTIQQWFQKEIKKNIASRYVRQHNKLSADKSEHVTKFRCKIYLVRVIVSTLT